MNFGEIKDLTVEELRKRILLTRQDLFQLKMKHSLGQIQSPIEIRKQRRGLAQMETALTGKLRG
jgi:large subunit ribosomal protein L29